MNTLCDAIKGLTPQEAERLAREFKKLREQYRGGGK